MLNLYYFKKYAQIIRAFIKNNLKFINFAQIIPFSQPLNSLFDNLINLNLLYYYSIQ